MSAAIVNLIRQHGALGGLSAADLRDAINAKTIERRDDRRKNLVDVIGVLGTTDAAACSASIEAAIAEGSPLPSAVKTLLRSIQTTIGTTGINLAGDETRAIIDGMVAASVMPSDLATRIKGIGRSYASLADSIGGDVTEEQCQAALATVAAEDAKALLFQRATARWNNVLALIGDGTVTSEAEAITIFGA